MEFGFHVADREGQLVNRTVMDSLEARRLLAIASDYFPLIPGTTWDYAGTYAGESATEHVTAVADTLNGKNVVRIDSSVTTASDDDDGGSTWYSQDKTGTYVHKILSGEGTNGVTINFITPMKFLPAEINFADVLTIPETPATVTISEPTQGTFTASGVIYGTYAVPDSKAFKLPDGRMTHTFQVSLDLRYEFSGKAPDGSDFSFLARDGQTYWLAKYMGPLEFAEDLGGRFTIKGENRDAFVQGHMAATGASLIPERPSIKNGVYTVNGTQFDDQITVTGGTTSWYVQFNGMSESVNVGTSTPINVFGHDGSDIIRVEIGRGAYVDAGAGNDSVSGSWYPDTFTGGAGKDRLFGHGGDDRLAGNGGHDSLLGWEGDDRLYGGNENDTMEGGNGVDRLWGGSGDDVMAGNGSNDKLFGEAGRDILSGGNQNDLLDGGTDADQLFGGAGVDTFTLADSFIDTADGGTETDLLAASDPDDVLANM